MRIIAHLDMDAFFAAVEERDNPRFKGKPIVVGADPKGGAGRGVVATASYAARKYGIRSAMPISVAWRLSEEARLRGEPSAVFVGGRMRRYGEVSGRIFTIVRKHVPSVEEASIDEAYLDLSFTGGYEAATDLLKKIQGEIFTKERLTCSVGMGPNKLIAKIASDKDKPNGLTVVREEEAEAFLSPLSIREIPGIGPKTEELLNKKGVRTVGELRNIPLADMEELMGKWGARLYRKARGEDDSPVTEAYEVKSVGEQETFERDLRDPIVLSRRLQGIAEAAFKRFKRSGFQTFRTVSLIVRFGDFETKTRAHTLTKSAGDAETLEFEAMKLFLPFLDARENPRKKSFRLLGVRLEKLGTID